MDNILEKFLLFTVFIVIGIGVSFIARKYDKGGEKTKKTIMSERKSAKVSKGSKKRSSRKRSKTRFL